MIELKITGAEPREFFKNAAEAFMLLAHGGQNMFAQAPADAPTKEQQANRATVEKTADAVAEENPKVLAEPKTRKPRAQKAPVVIEAEPNLTPSMPMPDLPEPEVVDEDPLGLNDVAKPADEKTYTVDDMRQRVKDILAAHGPKTKDAPNARGNEMPVCVAYVRKLFAPFGVKLAAEIPPDRFAEFMAASEPYLDGTAE